ncbi:hypothetical protein C8255_15375 [filamentous cyanobacterium CCP3]|nr:hypothetical protein C8255_15375 [filamentous cyanobacterium CCP3]
MLTVSFGVASLVPTASQRVEHLMQMADQALYVAKAQVATWPPDRHRLA